MPQLPHRFYGTAYRITTATVRIVLVPLRGRVIQGWLVWVRRIHYPTLSVLLVFLCSAVALTNASYHTIPYYLATTVTSRVETMLWMGEKKAQAEKGPAWTVCRCLTFQVVA